LNHSEKVLPMSFPRTRESSNRMPKQPAVYILASKRNGTLYIGVTSDLQKRAWEHKTDLIDGFTKRYGIHRPAYYALHGDMVSAILGENR
jgi:putative endonuclease